MRGLLPATLTLCLLAGCDGGKSDPDWNRMVEQPGYRRYERNPVFADGATLQPPPAGIVARSDTDGRPAAPPVTDRAALREGRELFGIWCACCHGVTGAGNSFVADRMHTIRPRDLLDERVRRLDDAQLLRVIELGYGGMPAYGDVLDRQQGRRIVAWLRCLQLSRRLPLDRLDPQQRQHIEAGLP